MIATTELPDAERDVRRARDRFLGTAAVIEQRLRPTQLIETAVTDARSGLADLARDLGGKARSRPGTAAATVAGALLFILHRPLLQLVRKAGRKRSQ